MGDSAKKITYRDDQLVLPFPCYAFETSTGLGVVVLQYDLGNAMVLLSNEQMLARYRKRWNLRGLPIRFTGQQQLLEFLRTLPPSINLVTIDPGESQPNVVEVSYMVRKLAERVGLWPL